MRSWSSALLSPVTMTQDNQNIKTFPNKNQEQLSSNNKDYPNVEPSNFNLREQSLNLGYFKTSVWLKFGSVHAAAMKAGLSTARTKQILNGHYLPKSPELIKKIAAAWGYDAVVLTLLFDKYRKEAK